MAALKRLFKSHCTNSETGLMSIAFLSQTVAVNEKHWIVSDFVTVIFVSIEPFYRSMTHEVSQQESPIRLSHYKSSCMISSKGFIRAYKASGPLES